MRKNAKILGLLLLIMLASSLAAAVEKPAATQAAPADGVGLDQDVITASDAGGGYLSTRDILLIILIVLAIFGLAAIL